jgi:hypothetical protein
MTDSQSNTHEQGSNNGAVKILLFLILGPVLLGGLWSQLGPRNRLAGTWELTGGDSFDVFRFDADGSYWRRSSAGLLSVNLGGSYRVVESSGDRYRVRIETEFGEIEEEYRLESPDRLVAVDPDNAEDLSRYTRIGDWVMAVRPSASPSTYDGAKPHLGCWQRQGASAPALELREDGALLRYAGGEVKKATYSIDYSKIPFQLDVTDAEGGVDREIFDFATGGALRISQTHLTDGARPDEMNRYQTYFPCSPSDSQGDS